MNKTIKNRLIVRPLVLTVVTLAAALFVIWFVPHQLSYAISVISKSDQQVQFPGYMAYFVVLAFTFRPVVLLITNLLHVRRWKTGESPGCPVCRFPMVKRLARRGQFIGQRFWGCTQFPGCGGKVHIG